MTDPSSVEPLRPARREQLVHWFESEIPFNRHLGVRVVSIERGHCLLRLPWSNDFLGDAGRGAVHGGVTSMLVDTTAGAACYSMLTSQEDACSTVDLRIDYLRPGRAGDLWCQAQVLRMGNRVAAARALVFSDDPRDADDPQPLATAQGVYNVVRR